MNIKIIKLLAFLSFFIITQISCLDIRAPLIAPLEEFTVQDKSFAQLRENVLTKLYEDIDFPIIPGVDVPSPAECRNAFATWLEVQFNKGLLPKRTVGPLEYGEGSQDMSKIAQCRSVDIEYEYKQAIKNADNSKEDDEDGVQDTPADDEGESDKGRFITLSKIRDALRDLDCIDAFLDADKDKVRIGKIGLKVLENTFTVKAPSFVIYTTKEPITPEEINLIIDADKEKFLLDNDFIEPLAITPRFEAGFTGDTPAKFVDKKNAHYDLLPLERDLIVFRQPSFNSEEELETKIIDGQEYYVIFGGGFRVQVFIEIEVSGQAGDGLCLYEKLKEDIETLDNAFKEKWEEKNK